MNTVQIIQDFVVELSQLFVYSDNAVRFTFVAFLSVRTIAAILATVIFFRSAELVALYRCGSQKVKSLSVGTDHIALMVNGKVTSPVRMIPVLLILAFLFVHGILHVLFHIVQLAI